MRWVIPGALLGVLVVGAVVVRGSEELSWRSTVVGHKAAGRLDDIGWIELAKWIQPGSPVYLEQLSEDPNPFMSIWNIRASAENEAAGSDLFAMGCASCHGERGDGGSAPSLLTPTQAPTDWGMFRVIQRGIPEKAMPPSGLDEEQIWQVIAHLRALAGAAAAGSADRVRPRTSPVTDARLEAAAAEPENWLLQNGNYSSTRFTALAQIDRANVHELGLVWAYQLETTDVVETMPLVNDGVMYVTEPSNAVIALDAATGARLWRYQPTLAADMLFAYGVVNRGVALMGDLVYLATLDARVIALDARTGRVRWETQASDPTIAHNFTSAPLAADGKIIVGPAGGDRGTNGFIAAFDAETGRELWRFETIPAAGEPGNDTWGPGNAWTRGGAAPWGIGSYDADLGLVYWGIGNPSPDFNGDVRPGDNLYASSVVALDADTGELEWYFQFTPHDTHDWDAVQVPVLVDGSWQGRERKLMLWANRNAFYYVLDRETGEFLHASPFVRQTWADGIDPSGRPIVREEALPSTEGTFVWPSAVGAANWWPPAFHPATELLYVPSLEQPGLFYKGVTEYEVGRSYLGTAVKPPSTMDLTHTPAVRAIDIYTGDVRFAYELTTRGGWSQVGGILATAGDVVFVGDYRTFHAFGARNGERLWTVELGGNINSAPSTYSVNGRQLVTIAAGSTLFTFGLPASRPSTGEEVITED